MCENTCCDDIIADTVTLYLQNCTLYSIQTEVSWQWFLVQETMQQFWILILILTSVVAERIDFRKLYHEAEVEVQEELKAKMILGATSQRFHFRKENSM